MTVAVEHSTLNYKDGLILQGLGRLVRQYPHVPGIDFAGRVLSSDNPAWREGDAVVLTGWRVGEAHWGGYAEKARVKGDWLVKLPAGLTTRQAMAIGTAGLHRHAGGDGAGGSWADARQGRGAGDRGGGRGGQRGDGHPRQIRLSGRGLHGAAGDP